MRLRNVPGARETIIENQFSVQQPEQMKGKWAEVFQNDHPIHIEVGMGKGQFIIEMARRNPERSVVLPQDMAEALDVYSSKKRITTSQAIRQFIEKGLSIESYEQHQTEIRKYIREEIETVLPIVIKPYMERLIKMQAVATRVSSAALQCNVAVLAENYIDQATPEEILANALRQSCRITRTKPKSDAEYLAEAHEWLNADLDTPSDK